MKEIMKEIMKSLFFVFSICVGSFASAETVNTEPCTKEERAKIESALELLSEPISSIPGVLKSEVDNCSERESVVATETQWVCGIFLYFKSDNDRTIFHQTSSLYGGALEIELDGKLKKVPLCSTTAPQTIN